MKPYILNAFLETPWGILPQKLAVLEAIVARHVAGEKLDAEEIQAAINGAPRPQERTINQVAVLPLFGVLIPRADMMSEVSGATSVEKFSARFDALLNDPAIDAIILDVNSPGGQVGGVQEVSEKLFTARGKKPIVAVANHLAASAAYWIATAADELVVSPSAQVGSIGVFAAHEDISKALEQEGVKISLVSAGKHKVEGNPYEPLSDEARATIQTRVNEVYETFIADVARNRHVNPDQVRNGFGQGRVVSAQQAVEYGMADRIGTMEETIARFFGDVNINGLQAASNGQAPLQADHDAIPEWIAQARNHYREIAQRLFMQFGGTTVNIREKIQARTDKLARAQELADLADAEGREFTDEERAEFEACLADADKLAQEIQQHNGDREKLRASLVMELNAPANQTAEKPDGESANAKVKTLDEFNQLLPAERMAFIKGGGQVK